MVFGREHLQLFVHPSPFRLNSSPQYGADLLAQGLLQCRHYSIAEYGSVAMKRESRRLSNVILGYLNKRLSNQYLRHGL